MNKINVNYNRKRHKTLEILSSKIIEFGTTKVGSNFVLGVSFEELQEKLNCNKEKCEIIFLHYLKMKKFNLQI